MALSAPSASPLMKRPVAVSDAQHARHPGIRAIAAPRCAVTLPSAAIDGTACQLCCRPTGAVHGYRPGPGRRTACRRRRFMCPARLPARGGRPSIAGISSFSQAITACIDLALLVQNFGDKPGLFGIVPFSPSRLPNRDVHGPPVDCCLSHACA